jgi:hypothetical protein
MYIVTPYLQLQLFLSKNLSIFLSQQKRKGGEKGESRVSFSVCDITSCGAAEINPVRVKRVNQFFLGGKQGHTRNSYQFYRYSFLGNQIYRFREN